jgi:hypothetical protein
VNNRGGLGIHTHYSYLYDSETGEVHCVATEDPAGASTIGENAGAKEISNRVLRPEQIPPIVREKIKILLELKKTTNPTETA